MDKPFEEIINTINGLTPLKLRIDKYVTNLQYYQRINTFEIAYLQSMRHFESKN
jgi:hypothetical protein